MGANLGFLTPVYEEVGERFDKLSDILERIESKLDVRRKVTITSHKVIPYSLEVREQPRKLQAPDQIRITLKNRGDQPIFMVTEAAIGTTPAWTLAPNDPHLTIETEGEIWVFCESPNVERLDVIYEI